ncbi:UNVERIFIED_CONTAM: putative serine/threonine-protein kinase, partial [Sesamum latifolium]
MLRVFGKNKLVLCFRNIKLPVKKNKGLKLSCGMGCVCSKGGKDDNKVKKEKGSKKSSKKIGSFNKEEEVVVEVDNGGNDATARLISAENAEKSAGSTPAGWEGDRSIWFLRNLKCRTRKNGRHWSLESKEGSLRCVGVFSVRNGVDGAQVVAGWPSWLTSVAGEAIKGWIPRKADSFEKLDK